MKKRKSSSRRSQAQVSLGAVFMALVVLVIPLMQGGLVTATLPVLSLLVGLGFLAESRRFLFKEQGDWTQAAPWVYVWLVVTLYIFGQAAAREIFHLELTINGIEFTRVYWLQHVKYWSFFTAYWLLAWVVSRQHGGSTKLIVAAVIAMALFQSLYGTIAFANGQDTILGIWPKTNYLSSVTGTFYNRNHLAGFLAVAMPLGTAYLLSSRWKLNIRNEPAIKGMAAVLYLLICGAALIGTASRLGILCALIGFLVWGWLYTRRLYARSPARYIWLGLLVVLPVLAGLWFGPGYLIERLLQIDQATGRLRIWQAMFGVPWDVWVQGIGAGSFLDVFKLIHPPDHTKSVWRAHSEYLQVVFELGIVGIAVIAPFIVHWYRRCWPKNLDGLQIGALAGVIAVMLHNIADFDLQVPGTAVAFWIALGLLFRGNSNRAESHVPASELFPVSSPDGGGPRRRSKGKSRTRSGGT